MEFIRVGIYLPAVREWARGLLVRRRERVDETGAGRREREKMENEKREAE